jgi:hypothetical protein
LIFLFFFWLQRTKAWGEEPLAQESPFDDSCELSEDASALHQLFASRQISLAPPELRQTVFLEVGMIEMLLQRPFSMRLAHALIHIGASVSSDGKRVWGIYCTADETAAASALGGNTRRVLFEF